MYMSGNLYFLLLYLPILTGCGLYGFNIFTR